MLTLPLRRNAFPERCRCRPQSHSQAAVTAAQIQDYGFGTIVGEETGEYPSLYASIFSYALPRTGITVQISKGYIVRVSGGTTAKGVVPDILI